MWPCFTKRNRLSLSGLFTRAGRLLFAAVVPGLLTCAPGFAEVIRVATFNTGLERDGPGLLLRDLLRGEDEQIKSVIAVIAKTRPDILHVIGIDYDFEARALSAFADALARAGAEYPYIFALRPNSGMATGLDMNGDGRRGGPQDAQGFGRFSGQGGMAVLSRFPILSDQARDFSGFLWADLPGGIPPVGETGPFPSAKAFSIQRLSSSGHWDVPVALPGGEILNLLAFHATPPVFDGPEDLNGRRNHDEAAFWLRLLDGELPFAAPSAPFVLLGGANLDPADGDGRPEAMQALLADPRLQDPAPAGPGGAAAANTGQKGDPALDTADWRDPVPGNLRVDYVLPSADLNVAGSAVFWPAPGSDMARIAETASRHRLVWVDLEF